MELQNISCTLEKSSSTDTRSCTFVTFNSFRILFNTVDNRERGDVMQGIVLLIAGIARLIVSIGLIYVLFKVGKFLDVLPDILVRRKEEKE